MSDCIFCKIISKEIPANIIYEDENVISFYDAHPVAPIHFLVIPKKHIKSLNYLEKDDIMLVGHIQYIISKISKDLNIADDGYRVICNTGSNGGQVINHIHYHVLAGKKLGSKIVN